MILDPEQCATVLRVEAGSPAEKAGFRAGDAIQALAGQPLLSLADVQWVLHQVPASGGSVKAVVKRDNKTSEVALELPAGWRQRDDIAWRASTWEMRRMSLGGMFLKPMTAEQRAERKLPARGMAFRVEHTGQFPPHDVAKKAGVVKEDVLISFNGRTDFQRETDLLAYALNEVPPGSTVPAVVRRGDEKINIELTTGR